LLVLSDASCVWDDPGANEPRSDRSDEESHAQLNYLLMSKFAEPMSRLIDELKKLPGIGAKSAQRLAFHILRSSGQDAEALAAAVRDVKAKLRLCSVCNNITDVDPCAYCTSPTRNQRLVCVVEEPTNIAAIEKTKHFNGVFHVLHGAISPLHGVGPDQLRISNLVSRVDAGNVDEVILATNPTVEGEATAVYLAQQLKRSGVKVTRIAMGIPVGSDIEYTDEITMLKAMEGRRDV
jgi:recombination protein RecR